MVDGVVDIPLPGRPLESRRPDAAWPRRAISWPGRKTGWSRWPSARCWLSRLIGDWSRLIGNGVAAAYNPLVLYGPSGTGKSHLARGLAAAWKARNRRQRVVCTTAVDFARELADAIETPGGRGVPREASQRGPVGLRRPWHVGHAEVGQTERQEELIHTLDALLAEERWVVVTASAAPAELPGLVAGVAEPADGRADDPVGPARPGGPAGHPASIGRAAEVELPEPVAQVLAEGLVRHGAGTGRRAAAIGRAGRLRGASRSTFAAAEQYLAERSRKRQPSLHEIALATARHFSLRLSDLRSPVRRRALVTARGVAVYLARQLTGESLRRSAATSAAATTPR